MAGGRKKGIEAGRAHVKAFWDGSAIERGLGKMKTMIRGASDQLASIGTKMIGLGVGLGSIFAAPLKRAAEMELLEADLAVLLGSVAEAKKALADWRKFAAETPLEFKDVAELGKQLLNWKLATKDNVVEVLRQIGDASGGIPDRMQSVIRALGQMRATGRIQADEMNQLTEAGLPAWELLAKVLGTDVKGAMEAVEARSVDASLAVPALIKALGEFGQGRMAAMAKTLIGRLSQLKDAIWEAVTPIGEALLPYAGRLTSLASGLVGRIGAWIKANAELAVRVAAVAALLVTVGSVSLAAAMAIRVATIAASGLGLVIRSVLLPATLAITAATKIAAGTFAAASGAVRGMVAAVKVVSTALFGLAAVSSTVGYVLGAVTIAMKLAKSTAAGWAISVRLAAAATTAFTWTARAAAFAVVLFGGALKLVAITLGVIGAAFAIFSNPVVAAVLAIAALAAGLYAAVQSGVTFGGVLDWLKDRFGPLASKALAVFRVISDALMAGQFAAAAKVMWAAVQLAFAHGVRAIRDQWLSLKLFLLSTWIDVAASLESSWLSLSETVKGFLQGMAEAAVAHASVIGKALGTALAIAAKLADIQINLLRTAAQLAGEQISTEAPDTGALDSVEQRRSAEQQRLQDEIAASRAENDASTRDEFDALKQAMKEARIATAVAKADAERVPEIPGSDPAELPSIPALPDAEKKKRKVTAGDALNTAAVVGTVSGGETLAKALAGRRDGTEAAVKAGNQTLKAIERKLGRPVWVGEGQTR